MGMRLQASPIAENSGAKLQKPCIYAGYGKFNNL
jgi:hypothetical protein